MDHHPWHSQIFMQHAKNTSHPPKKLKTKGLFKMDINKLFNMSKRYKANLENTVNKKGCFPGIGNKELSIITANARKVMYQNNHNSFDKMTNDEVKALRILQDFAKFVWNL